MQKRKSHKRERNVFQSVLIGAALSAAVLLVFSLISSLILGMTDNPLALADDISLVALLLSAAMSGYTISRRARSSGMLISSLSSLLLCLVLLLVGAIVAGADLSGKVFLNYLCYMGVALLFARLGGIELKRKRRHR